MTQKVCARCGVLKSLDDFSPHRGQPQGRASYCRPCAAAYDRRRRKDPQVRERNAQALRRRRADPVVLERD